MDKFLNKITTAGKEGENIFAPSRKTLRSPISTTTCTHAPPQVTEDRTESPKAPSLDMTRAASNPEPHDKDDATTVTPAREQQMDGCMTSPRQAIILKLRKEEEDALERCKRTLRRIKLSLTKQKNINMDVKNGVSELDELVDIMTHCRKSWLNMETVVKKSEQNTSANPAKPMETQTPVTLRSTSPVVVETPMPTRPKRAASSPVATDFAKKLRGKDSNEWQTVTRKAKTFATRERSNKQPKPTNPPESKSDNREKKSKKPPVKSEAVLIKPMEGHSYADVLKSLRSKIQPSENASVKGIRKTRTGALLLELGKGEKIPPELFEKIKSTVQESASVRELKPVATVEIKDLDSLTIKEEVEQAIKELLTDKEEQIKVSITLPNYREQVRAYVTLSNEGAKGLLEKGHIKIGFVRAKIKLCETTKRCFRCFGFGHHQWDCNGPDRNAKGLCFRCGKTGHKKKECNNPPRCCLCVDAGHESVDHIPGWKRCLEFRKALVK